MIVVEKIVRFLKIIGGTTGVVTFVASVIVNHTEEYRMARMINNGDFGIKLEETFKLEFCVYRDDLKFIKKAFENNNRIVGLTGLKSIGKTSTLEYFSSQYNERSIFCQMNINKYSSITEALYARLYSGIYKMPFYLRQIRFNSGLSHDEILANVLRSAGGEGNRVRVFIDLTSNDGHIDHGNHFAHLLIDKPSIDALSPTEFTAERFIREAKDLVRDKRLINCMFCSSEGLMFEDEEDREGRLILFRAIELSLDMSKAFLKENYGCEVDESLLKLLPRNFNNLPSLGESVDKKLYVAIRYARIFESISKLVEYNSSKDQLLKLLAVAVKREITVKDIHDIARLSMYEFHRLFVETNILYETNFKTYSFQFDATRSAVEKLISNHDMESPNKFG